MRKKMKNKKKKPVKLKKVPKRKPIKGFDRAFGV